MEKLKQIKTDHSILDNDVIETLVEAQESVSLPTGLEVKMKANVQQKIQQEKACKGDGFSTHRTNDGEWVEAMQGAHYKILHNEGNSLDGVISYLIRLEAGVEMDGHNHPFDEECLMIEGDLCLGGLTLNKGDFHFAAAGVKHAHVGTTNGCIAFIRGPLPV